jgi:histidine triad (HIT) family protein
VSEPAASEDCLFCKIVAGEIPADIVDSDEKTVAFLDINPATRGHALVVPRKHAADLMEIEPEELEAVSVAAQRLAKRMRQALKPGGFNVLNSCGSVAWQSVFHFHMHVVPRYPGDPLVLPWKPTPGDPEKLKSIAEEIRPPHE